MFSILTIGSKRFTAMAVWPFIISRLSKEDLGDSVVHHERIHFRQQLEMLFVFFYLWYGVEYLIRLIHTGNKDVAYRNISFEKEAYRFEDFSGYLKERKPFSWIKFL